MEEDGFEMSDEEVGAALIEGAYNASKAFWSHIERISPPNKKSRKKDS